MASITFNYDEGSTLLKSIFHTAILAGATQIGAKKITPLDEALEDVRLGRVTTICTPKNGKKNNC
jgi:hypothetical protein